MSLQWIRETSDVIANILEDSTGLMIAEVFEVDQGNEWHYNVMDHYYGVEYGEDAENVAMQRVLECLGVRIQM